MYGYSIIADKKKSQLPDPHEIWTAIFTITNLYT